MSFRVRTFPFPVLAEFNDDYLPPAKFSGRAQFTVRDENGRSTPIMRYEFELVSQSLESMLDAKEAEVVVELDCRETLYRTVIRLGDASGELELEAGELIGGVDVTFYVLALNDIPIFAPAGINVEYGSQKFSVTAGDPLAITLADSAEFDFNWKSKPDLMKVLLAKELDPYAYEFDCTSSPIIIRVGEKYQQYWQQTRGDAATKPHLYQGIYKDCMAAALTILKNDPDNDTAWARALIGRLEDLGTNVDPNWEFDDINRLALKIVASQGIEKLVESKNAD
jgi:hypothetical protein